MKYIIKRTTAFADEAALQAGIDSLSITIEGTAQRFKGLMPAMDKISAVANEDLKPYIFIETQFKVQSVSTGWTLEVITDKGQIGLQNITQATVAQLTKGVLYLVSAEQSAALQVIPEVKNLVIPLTTTDMTNTVVTAATVPFFAFENFQPIGLLTLTVIQLEIVPANMQVNVGYNVQSAAIKEASMLGTVARR